MADQANKKTVNRTISTVAVAAKKSWRRLTKSRQERAAERQAEEAHRVRLDKYERLQHALLRGRKQLQGILLCLLLRTIILPQEIVNLILVEFLLLWAPRGLTIDHFGNVEAIFGQLVRHACLQSPTTFDRKLEWLASFLLQPVFDAARRTTIFERRELDQRLVYPLARIIRYHATVWFEVSIPVVGLAPAFFAIPAPITASPVALHKIGLVLTLPSGQHRLPRQLFLAQMYIGQMLSCIPAVASVRVMIKEPHLQVGMNPTYYRRRIPPAVTTTLKEEIVRLARAIRRTAMKERYLRFTVTAGARTLGNGRPSQVSMRERPEEEVVDWVMSNRAETEF